MCLRISVAVSNLKAYCCTTYLARHLLLRIMNFVRRPGEPGSNELQRKIILSQTTVYIPSSIIQSTTRGGNNGRGAHRENGGWCLKKKERTSIFQV
jgi:hypothetical protein